MLYLWFCTILRMSLTGSLLLFPLLCFGWLDKKKHFPSWYCRLYLLILAFFVVPFGVLLAKLLPPVPAPTTTLGQVMYWLDTELTEPLLLSQQVVPLTGNVPTRAQLLPVLWLVGVALFGLYYLAKQQRFQRALAQSTLPLTTGTAYKILQKQRRRLGIRAPIALRSHASINTPLLTGILKPCLIIPSGWMNDSTRLDYAILHELIHYQNHDLLQKQFALLVHGLHWFNPLCWVVRFQLSTYQEYRCDRMVANLLTRTEQKDYAYTIGNLRKPLSTLAQE